MRKVFLVLLNLLIFFFVIGIFGSAFSITGGDTIINRLAIGLVFAVLMAFVPNVLKFFKIQINFASMFLVTILLSFLFFFLALYFFGVISINAVTIDIGLQIIKPIELADRTVALLILSIFAAILSVSMEDLSQRK